MKQLIHRTLALPKVMATIFLVRYTLILILAATGIVWAAELKETLAQEPGQLDLPEEPTARLGAGQVLSIAFSPDGKLLASGREDRTIHLWDVGGQKQIGILQGHTGWVASVAFGPDGKILASGGWGDRTVRLWDVAGQKQVGVIQARAGVGSVAFSPDGRTLASSGQGDNAVRLWDVQTQKQIGVLELKKKAHAVAFSPDGKILASTGIGGEVHLWDVAGQKQVGELEGHKGETLFLAFSPDGKILASTVYWDDTVHLWDVERQEQVGVLRGHDASDMGWGDQVAFSPDGKWLAAGSEDGVELWELNLPAGDSRPVEPKGKQLATWGRIKRGSH